MYFQKHSTFKHLHCGVNLNTTRLFSRCGTVFRFFSSNNYTQISITQKVLALKFLGKMHVHKKIRLYFGCKRPSMLKVIAPYTTTTEPKLTHFQPPQMGSSELL